MSKKNLLWGSMLAALALASTSTQADGIRPAKSHPGLSEYTDQLIIRLKDEPVTQKRQTMSAAHVKSLSLSAGIELKAIRPTGAAAQVVKLPRALPIDEVQRIAAKLAQDTGVVYAEPDRRKYPHRVPTDTRYSQQWYLSEPTGGINAQSAWDVTTGSASIIVAVIDTGIVLTNSELQGRLLPGFDFIGSDDGDPSNRANDSGTIFATANDGNGRDSDPSDPGDWIDNSDLNHYPFQGVGCTVEDSSWHGTHVAGIIGANSDNAAGITGIDWAARILPVRVLGKCGGYTSDIVDGMRWAAGLAVSGVTTNSNPAQILNLSLGGPGSCSHAEQSAITEILSTTAVKAIVTSAGNEGGDASLNAPGNCAGVINVGATDRSGNQTFYTDVGPAIAISAPGGVITTSPSDTGANAILSLFNDGFTTPTTDAFAFFAGTSAAAPQVSGAIALMLAVKPGLTTADIRSILTTTARAFPSGSACTTATCGAGILDVSAAVHKAVITTPSTSSSSGSSGSSSDDGGGGGGCTIGNGTSDAGLMLLMLAALVGLGRRKR